MIRIAPPLLHFVADALRFLGGTIIGAVMNLYRKPSWVSRWMRSHRASMFPAVFLGACLDRPIQSGTFPAFSLEKQ